MSDSPRMRLVNILVEETELGEQASLLYNLLEEAYAAGEEGGFHHGRGCYEDSQTFEEWMSPGGE